MTKYEYEYKYARDYLTDEEQLIIGRPGVDWGGNDVVVLTWPETVPDEDRRMCVSTYSQAGTALLVGSGLAEWAASQSAAPLLGAVDHWLVTHNAVDVSRRSSPAKGVF